MSHSVGTRFPVVKVLATGMQAQTQQSECSTHIVSPSLWPLFHHVLESAAMRFHRWASRSSAASAASPPPGAATAQKCTPENGGQTVVDAPKLSMVRTKQVAASVQAPRDTHMHEGASNSSKAAQGVANPVQPRSSPSAHSPQAGQKIAGVQTLGGTKVRLAPQSLGEHTSAAEGSTGHVGVLTRSMSGTPKAGAVQSLASPEGVGAMNQPRVPSDSCVVATMRRCRSASAAAPDGGDIDTPMAPLTRQRSTDAPGHSLVGGGGQEGLGMTLRTHRRNMRCSNPVAGGDGVEAAPSGRMQSTVVAVKEMVAHVADAAGNMVQIGTGVQRVAAVKKEPAHEASQMARESAQLGGYGERREGRSAGGALQGGVAAARGHHDGKDTGCIGGQKRGNVGSPSCKQERDAAEGAKKKRQKLQWSAPNRIGGDGDLHHNASEDAGEGRQVMLREQAAFNRAEASSWDAAGASNLPGAGIATLCAQGSDVATNAMATSGMAGLRFAPGKDVEKDTAIRMDEQVVGSAGKQGPLRAAGSPHQAGTHPCAAATQTSPRSLSAQASASVVWHPPLDMAASLLPGEAAHVRTLHVGVLAQWQVICPRSARSWTCQHGDTMDAEAEPAAGWKPPHAAEAVLAARAMHRLALLHGCHWQLSVHLPASACGSGVSPAGQAPDDAHLPIHCAVAHRGMATALATGSRRSF
jgi:hypothetical protein